MQGRITEEHLGEADKSYPGIAELYSALDDKPPTFLQLLWVYEAIRAEIKGPDAAMLMVG